MTTRRTTTQRRMMMNSMMTTSTSSSTTGTKLKEEVDTTISLNSCRCCRPTTTTMLWLFRQRRRCRSRVLLLWLAVVVILGSTMMMYTRNRNRIKSLRRKETMTTTTTTTTSLITMVSICKQNIFQETLDCGHSNSNSTHKDSKLASTGVEEGRPPPPNTTRPNKLVLVRLLGNGARCYGFEAKLYSSPTTSYRYTRVMAKITYDDRLYHLENEYQMFQRLHHTGNTMRILTNTNTNITTSSSIHNSIPQVYGYIRSMPNPFSHSYQYLNGIAEMTLPIAAKFRTKQRIGILLLELLTDRVEHPQSLPEFHMFATALLDTIRTVHALGIIHGDLHWYNIWWTGGRTISIFDWNNGRQYVPNTTMFMWRDDFSFPELYPPEAYMNSVNRNTNHHNRNRNIPTTPERNASAVHTNVYGFDMYSIGLILDIALDYPKVCGNETTHTTSSTSTVASSSRRLRLVESNSTDTTLSTTTVDTSSSSLSSECRLAHELVTFLLTPDPYQRPDTNVALNHPFFSLYS